MAGELIDFADLAAALVDRAEMLVPQWLPGGSRRGKEWVCADLSGGEGTSCSVNLVNGRWGDFGTDEKGGDLISLYAAIHGLNMGQAARQIQRDMGWARDEVQASAQPARSARQVPDTAREGEGDARALDGGDRRPEPPADSDRTPRKSMWRAVVPVPAHAPKPDFRHWHYPVPSATWEYSFEGVLYGHVVRYTTSDGGKEVLPHTWCVDESDTRGTCRWHFKQWDEPRPLYVPATVLSADLSLTVVLVEGEKCALAGHQLLGHEYDFVTWPGGGKAWPKAALGWLMGRKVILWPDCDAKRERLTKAEREAGVDPVTKALLPEGKQPGVQAMVGAGQALMADHGCTVLMVPLPKPGAVADGWDLADAVADGWGADEVRAFLAGAKPFNAPSDEARAKVTGQISTASKAAAGLEEDDAAGWRKHLILAGTGAIKPVRENAVVALDGVPDSERSGVPEAAGVIGYNEFTNDLIKTRKTPWGTPAGEWQEVDELLMGEWLVREHWLPSMPRGTLEEAVRMVAFRHRFHPVRQYLQRLKWDGTKRLSTWLRRSCLEEDEWDDTAPLQRYLARVGTFFLMGMCQRVIEPGCKFDWMLILEGAQGMRKSTLLRVLAGDYFADTGLVLGDKDSYQQLQGRWLYEFGELDSFGKAEVTKIKSFIASSSDYFRASFDRRAREYPRQLVFGGTTNEDHYLTDPTGNRRFWPVRVTRTIDIDWVQENRDQLFAEAMARLEAGARLYPTPEEERELFVPQQQNRAVENAIEAAVTRYLYDEDQKPGVHGINGAFVNEISLVELLGRIGIGIEKLGPGRFHEKQAAAALRRLGWIEGRSSRPGRPRVYKRPADDQAMRPARQESNGADAALATEGADSDCPF
ncbi:MAG: VapE domain-containing protein [Leptothrix sp. (in: b-proteobacteria)]